MTTLFREGGFPMFVIVALGVAAIVTTVRAVRSPSLSRIALGRGLGRATLWATLVGLVADIAAVCHKAPSFEQPGFDLPHVVLAGLGESMSPAILGFAMLALVSLGLAIAESRAVES